MSFYFWFSDFIEKKITFALSIIFLLHEYPFAEVIDAGIVNSDHINAQIMKFINFLNMVFNVESFRPAPGLFI